MICRKRPGFLDIRSVSGDVAYEVNLGGESAIRSAALDGAGERLALACWEYWPHEWASADDVAEAKVGSRLVLFHLATGERRVLCEGLASSPVWFPGEDRLAFSSGTAVCLADVGTGRVEEVFEVCEAHEMQVSPDGRGLAFVQWEEGAPRVGVVDLDTREGAVYADANLGYCWWDTGTILYSLEPGLHLLDLASGESRPLVSDLRALDESGALAALGEAWVRAVRREGGDRYLGYPTPVGDRLHFGAGVMLPWRRGFLPFMRKRDPGEVHGILSMTRGCTDLRLHHAEMLADAGLVPLNNGRTLAIHVSRGSRRGPKHCWVFVGEGAESVPEGYGPLPKAAFGVRGDIPVGDFARPD
jgi:hypothetical protein